MTKSEIINGCKDACKEILTESELETLDFTYDETLEAVNVNGPDEVLDKVALM